MYLGLYFRGIAESATSLDGILLQYGALGVLTLGALAVAKVLFKNLQDAYQREKERSDRLEAELRQLNEAVRDQYIDTISQATSAVANALAAVRGRDTS